MLFRPRCCTGCVKWCSCANCFGLDLIRSSPNDNMGLCHYSVGLALGCRADCTSLVSMRRHHHRGALSDPGLHLPRAWMK